MADTIDNKVLVTLSEEEQAVLKTILFFDVFGFPLKPSEVHQYAPISMSPLNVLPCLNFIVNHGLLFQHGNFFSLKNDDSIVQKRQVASDSAESMLKVARRFASLISRFPFVRSICITGNLTRGFVVAEDDLEFFIIAKTGRIWLTRALLRGFKKVFLLNNKRYFNMNYFVDEAQLEVEDKNQFTALQLKTLLPVYNAELYEQFIQANTWTAEYLPNMKPAKTTEVVAVKTFPIKATVEAFFNVTLGSMLDKSYRQSSLKQWAKDGSVEERALKLLEPGNYISMPLLRNTQHHVMTSLDKRLEAFKSENKTNLE